MEFGREHKLLPHISFIVFHGHPFQSSSPSPSLFSSSSPSSSSFSLSSLSLQGVGAGDVVCIMVSQNSGPQAFGWSCCHVRPCVSVSIIIINITITIIIIVIIITVCFFFFVFFVGSGSRGWECYIHNVLPKLGASNFWLKWLPTLFL